MTSSIATKITGLAVLSALALSALPASAKPISRTPIPAGSISVAPAGPVRPLYDFQVENATDCYVWIEPRSGRPPDTDMPLITVLLTDGHGSYQTARMGENHATWEEANQEAVEYMTQHWCARDGIGWCQQGIDIVRIIDPDFWDLHIPFVNTFPRHISCPQ